MARIPACIVLGGVAPDHVELEIVKLREHGGPSFRQSGIAPKEISLPRFREHSGAKEVSPLTSGTERDALRPALASSLGTSRTHPFAPLTLLAQPICPETFQFMPNPQNRCR